MGLLQINRFVEEFQPLYTDIALCGSMTHRTEMTQLIEQLEAMGLSVSTPGLDAEPVNYEEVESMSEVGKIKGRFIRRHFANIYNSKAVLVANYEKNGIEGYIGANTLLEMCAAFIYEKPIYILNPITKLKGYEEILGLEPIVIDGDLRELELQLKKTTGDE